MRIPPPNPEIVEMEAKLKALKRKDAVLNVLRSYTSDLESGVISVDTALKGIPYSLGCTVTLGANLDRNHP